MYISIASLTPMDNFPLMPAPNVRDVESMPEPTSEVGLTERAMQVIWTYRGYLLYLENGASLYRDSSKSVSGNGLLGDPTGPEDCIVTWRGKAYRAFVYFNINVEPQASQA